MTRCCEEVNQRDTWPIGYHSPFTFNTDESLVFLVLVPSELASLLITLSRWSSVQVEHVTRRVLNVRTVIDQVTQAVHDQRK